MDKSYRPWLAVLAVVLLLLSLACSVATGKTSESQLLSTEAGIAPQTTSTMVEATLPVAGLAEPLVETAGDYDTQFPLPEDVHNFVQLDSTNDSINFQTGMSMDDVIEFYRQAFKSQGLTERPSLTVIESGKAFSMVFDGSPNGKALVIQGVFLSSAETNINIRYEDL